jgi:hypothetical protein
MMPSELRGLDPDSDSPASSFKDQNDTLSIRSKRRKRARCQRGHGSRQKSEAVEVLRGPVVGDNARILIETWLAQFPETFPSKGHIEALATLTSLPPQTVEKLFSQMLRDCHLGSLHGTTGYSRNTEFSQTTSSSQTTGSSRATNYFQTTSSSQSNDSFPSKPRIAIRRPVSALHTERPILKEAALFVKGRQKTCRPVQNPTLSARDNSNTYHCTLKCGYSSNRKDDWRRHEEQNYSQEGWICDLEAAVLVGGILTCAYCETQNPEQDHLVSAHPRRAPQGCCHNKPLSARGRIFYRKEHVAQHFRSIHPGIPCTDHLDQNHFVVDSKFPRWCGFCSGYRFNDWQDRIEHLSAHFEAGLNLASWKQPQMENENGDKDDDYRGNNGDGGHHDGSSDDDSDSGGPSDLPDHVAGRIVTNTSSSSKWVQHRCIVSYLNANPAHDGFQGQHTNLPNSNLPDSKHHDIISKIAPRPKSLSTDTNELAIIRMRNAGKNRLAVVETAPDEKRLGFARKLKTPFTD